MVGERGLSPVEQSSDEQKRKMEMEHLMTEAEAMQQEVITRLPGPVAFLLDYEFRPLVKVIVIIALIVAMYFLFGLDVILSSAILFAVVAVIVYMVQIKSQRQDFSHFFEVKKAGQIIENGDHSPYKNSFMVQTDRVSMWAVPNHLIRKNIFKMPAGHEISPLPAQGNVIFIDLFDEFNRTCVFPKTEDVANISFESNMNPILSRKLDRVADAVNHAEIVEGDILNLYRAGQISKKQLTRMLKNVHRERISALASPTSKRRDIVFDLQRTIPQFQDKIRFLQDNMHLLADEMATAGIYQVLKIPMPDKVRQDHNLIRAIYGLPKIKEYKPKGGVNITGKR